MLYTSALVRVGDMPFIDPLEGIETDSSVEESCAISQVK
jgi:hypothetical protein